MQMAPRAAHVVVVIIAVKARPHGRAAAEAVAAADAADAAARGQIATMAEEAVGAGTIRRGGRGGEPAPQRLLPPPPLEAEGGREAAGRQLARPQPKPLLGALCEPARVELGAVGVGVDGTANAVARVRLLAAARARVVEQDELRHVARPHARESRELVVPPPVAVHREVDVLRVDAREVLGGGGGSSRGG